MLHCGPEPFGSHLCFTLQADSSSSLRYLHVRTSMHARAHTYMCVRVRECVRVCAGACVCVRMCVLARVQYPFRHSVALSSEYMLALPFRLTTYITPLQIRCTVCAPARPAGHTHW